MEKQARFPYQFFVVAFVWSWLIWLPLVLASAGILPLGKDLLSALTPPVTIVAMFGPAAGTFYCLRTLHGKDAMRRYLRGLLDFRLGWRAWLLPILVLGGSTWIAWMLPELWGEPRAEMLLPSVWIFPPYVLLMMSIGRRAGRTGVARLYLGPPGSTPRGVVGEPGAGSDLGLLAFAAIFYPGNEPDVHALCRVCAIDNGVFLVLRLGAPGFRKTTLGRVDFSRLGQCVCSLVPYGSDGCGGRTGPLLDMGKLDLCDWFDNDGYSVAAADALIKNCQGAQ